MALDTHNLNKLMLSFCHEYVKDLNATRAAIRAGYKASGATVVGCGLLQREDVKAVVEQLFEQRKQRMQIDADYVVQTIYDTVERCKEPMPVLNKAGNPVYFTTPDGEKEPLMTFDPQGVLRGIEMLGKHLNMFNPIQSVINNYAGSFDMSKLSEQQLEALGRGILPEGQQYIIGDQDGE